MPELVMQSQGKEAWSNRNWYDKRDSLELRLSFFLILGAGLGTIFCNWMGEEAKASLAALEQSYGAAALMGELDFGGLFMTVLWERAGTLCLGFLISLTSISGVLFSAAAVYLGFSTAVFVSAMTMSTGIFAIFRYAGFVFPQCLFYVPVLYFLWIWLPGQGFPLKVRDVLFLTAVTFFGVLAESFINPWLAALL